MPNQHSTLGKVVIFTGYAFGAFLLVAAILVTILVGAALLQGKTRSGDLIDTTGYVCGSLLIVVFWCYSALVLGIAHLVRTSGSRRLSKFLARILCIFIPFGTVFAVLTFVYLGRQQGQINDA